MIHAIADVWSSLIHTLHTHPSRADAIWALAAIACGLTVPLTVVAGHFDRRLISGDPVWSKPFKFSLALSMHFATFAVFAGCLPQEYLDYAGMHGFACWSTCAGIAELAYIVLQAARGRHSHFNTQTSIETIAAAFMGIGALIVIAPAVYLGSLLIFYAPSEWPAAIVVGTVSGFIGGAVLTLVTALRMGRYASRFADAKADTGRKMWLTGWCYDRADLRPAHFLATHMMQVVPLFGIAIANLLPGGAALPLVVAMAGVWICLTLRMFRETVRGRALADIFQTGFRLGRSFL